MPSRRNKAGAGTRSPENDNVAENPAPRGPGLISFLVIAVISLVAFANSLHNEFIRDDLLIILQNPMVHSWGELPALLGSSYWASATRLSDQLYRPLSMISYLVNYSIGGSDPFGYHVVNLLLHVLVAFGVYQLGLRLGLRWDAAVLGGVLFAVHPIHTEAVDPITGRADLLSTLAVLLALNWYIDFDQKSSSRLRWIVGSWAAFGIGLFCKETAIVLPGLLLLYEMYASAGKRDWRYRVRDKGALLSGYLLTAAVYLAVRWTVLGGVYRPGGEIAFLDNPVAAAPWDHRIVNALMVAGRYLLLFVWPLHLSTDYSYNAIPLAVSPWDVRVLGSLSVWLGLCSLAVWSYRRGGRLAFFAAGYLLIAFLPASNWIVPIGTIMGERLLYMPSIALCLFIAGSWHWVFQRYRLQFPGVASGVCYALAVLIVMLLTVRTIVRNRDWSSSVALWEAAARVVPNSAKVQYVLGFYALRAGRFAESGERFERALEIYPAYPQQDGEFARRYGAVLLRLHRPDEAISYLETAVKDSRHWADAQLNLGLAYASQESWKAAEAAFRKAITLDIKNHKAHKGLMVALRMQGRYQEAIHAADDALAVDNEFDDARLNKAAALAALGRKEEARNVLLLIEASRGEPRQTEEEAGSWH